MIKNNNYEINNSYQENLRKNPQLLIYLDKLKILRESENLSQLLYNIADVHNIEVDKHHSKHFELKESCGFGQHYFIYDCPNCAKRHFAKLPCNSFLCEDCRKYLSARIKRHTKKYLWTCNHTFSVWTIPTELKPFIQSWNDKKAIGLFYKAVQNSINQYCKQRKIKIGYILLPHSHGSLKLNWFFHLNALITSQALNKENLSINFKPDFKILRKLFKKNLSKLFNVFIVNEPQIKFAKDKKTKSYYIPYKRAVNKVLDYFRHIPLNIKNIEKITNETIIYHTSKSKSQNIHYEVTHKEFYDLVIQHIPPANFRTLRHIGLYSNHNKKRLQYPTNPGKETKKEIRCKSCKSRIKQESVVGIVQRGLLVWVNASNPSILDCKDFECMKEDIINQNGRLLQAMPPPDSFCWLEMPKFIDEDTPNDNVKSNDSMNFYSIKDLKLNIDIPMFEFKEKSTDFELTQKRLFRLIDLKENKLKLTNNDIYQLVTKGIS